MLILPTRRSVYLDVGLNRSIFMSEVGDVDKTMASWDLRLGTGYLVLTEAEKFLYSPFATVDIGAFPGASETGGHEIEIPSDQRAMHYAITIGISFAYHNRQEALVGHVTLAPSKPGQAQGKHIGHVTLADEPDRDRDGVPDAMDRCPKEKEDGLPPNGRDGCTSQDPDQDGVTGKQDRCPMVKEDKLPPNPSDGCPSSDPDQDGFTGQEDMCPDQPETVNGIDDGDGCPDEGRVELDVESGRIAIAEKIYFDARSSRISRDSLLLLGEIARTLRLLPALQLVEIQGHADDRGAEAENLRLTQERAEAVRMALINRGVEPERLTAVGYGEYCPVEAGQTDAAREKNRRVELKVVRTSQGPTKVETACQQARDHGITGTAIDAQGPSMDTELGDEPSHTEVMRAVATADASLLFPDYHACPQGEPTVDRVVVLDVRQSGDHWMAKVDGLVTATSPPLPADCFKTSKQRRQWLSLYNNRTTFTVHLRWRAGTLGVIVP